MKYATIVILENTDEKIVDEITYFDKHGKKIKSEKRTRKKK
jgi:hypothetical protein